MMEMGKQTSGPQSVAPNMQVRMQRWRERMRALRDEINGGVATSDEARANLPRFQRPCELRQAWARWLQANPEEEPEPFDGTAPPFMMPPCLKVKILEMRQKKKETEAKGAESSGSDSDDEIVVIQDGGSSEDEVAMVATKTAKLLLDEQSEKEDEEVRMDEEKKETAKTPEKKLQEAMQNWRDAMKRVNATHPRLAGRFAFQHPWQVRMAWAKWLNQEPGTPEPYPGMPLWMIPPCLRQKVKNQRMQGASSHDGAENQRMQGTSHRDGDKEKDEGKEEGKKNKFSPDMAARMQQWREHMRAIQRRQRMHKDVASEEEGCQATTGDDSCQATTRGYVLPRFHRPCELRRAWGAWIRSQPSDLPEPFRCEAPLFMVPPCLRAKVAALRRQKQEKKAGSSDEDMEVVSGGEEEKKTGDGGEKDAGSAQAKKAEEITAEKSEVQGKLQNLQDGEKEAMQRWRKVMRSLRTSHPKLAEKFPFDHPWQVRKAWAEWLKTEPGSPDPFPGMPFWMIPPCLRKGVLKRKMTPGEHGKGMEETGESSEQSGNEASAPPPYEGEKENCIRVKCSKPGVHCMGRVMVGCKRRMVPGHPNLGQQHGHDGGRKDDMQEWRSMMRNLHNTHPGLFARHHFDQPREVRQALTAWLKTDPGTPEPYPGMPLWMVPPCVRQQVRERRAQQTALYTQLRKMKISEETAETSPGKAANKSCGHHRHHQRNADVEQWRQSLKEAGVTSSPQEVRAQWLAWLEAPEQGPMPYPLELAPPRIRPLITGEESPAVSMKKKCCHRGKPKMYIVLKARSQETDHMEDEHFDI